MKILNDIYGTVSGIPLSAVIKQLDKLTEMVNALIETVSNLGNQNELGTVKEAVKDLEKKLISQGDLIAEIIAGDRGDQRCGED